MVKIGLMVDVDFYAAYLADMFLEHFANRTEFVGLFTIGGGAVRTWNSSDQRAVTQRENCLEAFGKLNTTGEKLTDLFGLPSLKILDNTLSTSIGPTANRESAIRIVLERFEYQKEGQRILFIYTDEILSVNWLKDLVILNGHPAVLPFARGIGGLEQFLVANDEKAFRRAAGVSVHVVEKGIDTGPVLATQRWIDPFQFDCFDGFRANNFMLLFRTMLNVARAFTESADTLPVAVDQNPELRSRLFLRKQKTKRIHIIASQMYNTMQASR